LRQLGDGGIGEAQAEVLASAGAAEIAEGKDGHRAAVLGRNVRSLGTAQADDRAQSVAELMRGLEASPGIFGQAAPDEPRERRWNGIPQWRRLVRHRRVQNLNRRTLAEWAAAAEHLVEHRAKREQIGA